jgi:orotate phosphoribosyltransferase
MKQAKNRLIETLLLETPGVVNYSKENTIEVKPGVHSPIYINLKHTLPEYKVRHTIVRKLTELVGDDVDFICGMESGGTYYASAIADLLLKPVILFRKKSKEYGDHKRVVGDLPLCGSRVAIIDDVFATGLTVSEAVKCFHEIGCKVKIFSIFSYGFNKEIGSRLNVEVYSLANFFNLCCVGEKAKKFSKEDVGFLMDHVSTYKNFLI